MSSSAIAIDAAAPEFTPRPIVRGDAIEPAAIAAAEPHLHLRGGRLRRRRRGGMRRVGAALASLAVE